MSVEDIAALSDTERRFVLHVHVPLLYYWHVMFFIIQADSAQIH